MGFFVWFGSIFGQCSSVVSGQIEAAPLSLFIIIIANKLELLVTGQLKILVFFVQVLREKMDQLERREVKVLWGLLDLKVFLEREEIPGFPVVLEVLESREHQ